MVRLSDFNKIIYKRPRVFRYDKSLENIVGFDSEAYKSGASFLYTTSRGDVLTPDNLIDILFKDYVGANFVTWNLKYESGAILRIFPTAFIKRLQEDHKAVTVYHGVKYTISYLPHKQLKIRTGKSVIRFWDISPFYGRMKLGTAAEKYLSETKTEGVNPDLFTVDYVEKNFDTIVKYCIQDSVLTCKLAELWIEKFEETGVPVTSLYSEASISFSYISRKAEIVTPWEYWNTQRKMLRLAFESYEGGKFEVTMRGKFTGFEYDISSAYPYEIANLVDIRKAVILYGRAYIRDAVYAFLRVHITLNNPDIHLPCGLFKKLRVYPIGSYYLTITKQEYDYIKEIGVKIRILDAVWIVPNGLSYPYKQVMGELYALKQEWKKKDLQRSHNYKIIMNGFYGKMAQCISDKEGEYVAGMGWNPVYSSVITANTRIAVTRLQNLLKDDCLAVHTDSVITTKPIPESFMGGKLGQFEFVVKGEGIIVACGVYEINGQCALKGFKKTALTSILKEHPGKLVIRQFARHVESWLQAMSRNADKEAINVFNNEYPKDLKLNCDTKRIWERDLTSTEFLETSQYSMPLIEMQESKPSYWKE